FNAGIARSRDVIEPPVDIVLSTNQKLLIPGTIMRLLVCANDSTGKAATRMSNPLQRRRVFFMGTSGVRNPKSFYFFSGIAAFRKTLLLKPAKSEGTQKYSPSSVPGTNGICVGPTTHGWV